ncbi:U6 snRNA-associated Sm-like protein LSm8 [Trametes pubescens]|uniref:LSM2-LSM8 complex subunit LSM8 n=2 Tax=Trametes TaxID=5324 RepID=A0A1M2VMP1_TRAPU|nr:U6 snRNA-associated Sm-like protein LSm8 [Trametes pubescens]
MHMCEGGADGGRGQEDTVSEKRDASWSRVVAVPLTPHTRPPDSPVNDACAVGRVRDASIVQATFTPPAVDACSWTTMAGLQSYVDQRVLLILQDGRAIVGVMAGYDQKSNVVLSDSKERVYSMDEGVEEIPLGLYLVKGDQIVLIGEVDEAADNAVDLSTIHAEPLPPIRY